MTGSDTRSDADGLDEHYAYSTVTDTWYLVHDYEEAGPNGKIVAKSTKRKSRSTGRKLSRTTWVSQNDRVTQRRGRFWSVLKQY